MSTQITVHPWSRLLLAAIPALGTGCDVDQNGGGSTPIEFRAQAATTQNTVAQGNSPGGGGIWINNGLSDPFVGGIDPMFSLSSPLGMAEDEGVLADESTRIAAVYLVECALPLGASLVKEVDGEELVLQGRLGLAPEWKDGPCDTDCQEWVSACMLARTNVNAQAIPISLRAEHPAIGVEGHPNYPIYEASFFGNLFADPELQYMCAGEEDAAVVAHLEGRTCSSDPEVCGFVAYDDCWEQERCQFIDEDGGLTAVDCVANGTAFRTISVYIMEADDEDDDDEDGDDEDDDDDEQGGNGNGGNGGNGNGCNGG